MQPTLLVFLGAGIGGALRHGVNHACARLYGVAFPWGTLTVNVVGSLAMGLVIGWLSEEGPKAGALQWIGLVLVCFLLPAAICLGLGALMRKLGWIKENDLKLEL
jgi:fluoride ion exporter CrcB/FEX